jgi:hypothetical protein
MARTQVTSVSTLASGIVCEASLGGKSQQGRADIGTNVGNVSHDVIAMTFNVTVATTGNANLSCYRETLSGTAPAGSGAYIELLRVGSATSQVVSG